MSRTIWTDPAKVWWKTIRTRVAHWKKVVLLVFFCAETALRPRAIMDNLQVVWSKGTSDDWRKVFSLLSTLDTNFLLDLQTVTQILGPIDRASSKLKSGSFVYLEVKALLNSLKEHLQLPRSHNNREILYQLSSRSVRDWIFKFSYKHSVFLITKISHLTSLQLSCWLSKKEMY